MSTKLLFKNISRYSNETLEQIGIQQYEVELRFVSALLPTEEHYSGPASLLAEKIYRDGVWTTPILIEKTSNAILDGHHRYTAANQLALERVPVVPISYDDSRLEFTMWNEARTVSKNDVIIAARSGELLPAKTTRHILSPALPLICIDIADLRRR